MEGQGVKSRSWGGKGRGGGACAVQVLGRERGRGGIVRGERLAGAREDFYHGNGGGGDDGDNGRR